MKKLWENWKNKVKEHNKNITNPNEIWDDKEIFLPLKNSSFVFLFCLTVLNCTKNCVTNTILFSFILSAFYFLLTSFLLYMNWTCFDKNKKSIKN